MTAELRQQIFQPMNVTITGRRCAELTSQFAGLRLLKSGAGGLQADV
jgi:hypothetical protein